MDRETQKRLFGEIPDALEGNRKSQKKVVDALVVICLLSAVGSILAGVVFGIILWVFFSLT